MASRSREREGPDLAGAAEAALDALAEPLCLLDADGTVQWVNRAWREFARANGAPAGVDFVGSNYLGVCAAMTGPDVARVQHFHAALADVLSGQRDVASLEYPCHSPTAQRWYLATARRCGEGAQAQVLVTHVDVTARREAEDREAQTRAAHQQLREFAACLPGVVFQYRSSPGAGGGFDFISGAVEDLFGLRPDQVEADARVLLARVHADDLSAISTAFAARPSGGGPQRHEYRVRHPARGLRWHNVDSVSVPTSDGARLWQGYVSDVTDRGLSEAALRESEANLRAIFENVRQSFLLLAPDRTIRFFNRAAADASAAVAGRPLRVGASMDEWLSPGERDEFAAGMRTAMTGETVHGERRFDTPAGPVTYELRFEPVRDPGGPVTAVFYSALDVTARLRADEAGRELDRQRLRAGKHESLEAMAGGIAHQFNNLLAVIQSNLELARSQVSSSVDDLLGEAAAAVTRAATISGSLLSYLGQGSHRRESRHLVVELRAVLPKLRAAVPTGARLEADIDGALPWCTVDRPALQQVLLNLVTNAAEAVAGRGGTVTLAARRMARGPVGDPDVAGGVWGCVEIADDGPGMDPHILERAFDPFFSTRMSGRGLGLSVARGLVRAHGGRLELESSPGRGTRARVWLPASTPAELAQVRATTTPIHLRSARAPGAGAVLVVDDEPAVLRATRRLLQRAGHEVLTATGGAEAVALFTAAAETIGSVVLDLNMPGVDGWEVLAAIRRLRPETWVVVASGYDVTRLQSERRAVQPDEWVQKPFDAAELRRLLEPAAVD